MAAEKHNIPKQHPSNMKDIHQVKLTPEQLAHLMHSENKIQILSPIEQMSNLPFADLSKSFQESLNQYLQSGSSNDSTRHSSDEITPYDNFLSSIFENSQNGDLLANLLAQMNAMAENLVTAAEKSFLTNQTLETGAAGSSDSSIFPSILNFTNNALSSHFESSNSAISEIAPVISGNVTGTFTTIDNSSLLLNNFTPPQSLNISFNPAPTPPSTPSSPSPPSLEPIATSDVQSTSQNLLLNVPANLGMLSNDSDPQSSPLTVLMVNGTDLNVGTTINVGAGGLLTVHADGSYTYDPNGLYNYLANGVTEDITFTYRAINTLGDVSNEATVTITIVGANDNPTVNGITIE